MSERSMKPVGRERERDTFRATKERDKEGKVIMAHTGKEVVRSAYCEQHSVESTSFSGVNAHGWIFRCNGGRSDVAHYFTARPPK